MENNNKSFIVEISIWIGIFTGIFTILGVRIFDDKSLFKDNKADDSSLNFENNEIRDQSTVVIGDGNTINYGNIDSDNIENFQSDNQEASPIDEQYNEMIDSLNASKISMFDLDPKNNTEKYWFDHSDGFTIACFTDIIESQEHLAAHIGFHYGTNKNEITNPIYQLDSNYSICEGEIMWSIANDKPNTQAWIEFYSDDTLIYTTELLDEDNPDTKFSFSVKNVNELKIVKNGTETFYGKLVIIYPYLNLIK